MVRIALGQINTTVGDLDGNASKMAEWASRATSAGASTRRFVRPVRQHLGNGERVNRLLLICETVRKCGVAKQIDDAGNAAAHRGWKPKVDLDLGILADAC
jgi:hypothetical protein